jgi:uncharacterized protein (TIGR00251 family)
MSTEFPIWLKEEDAAKNAYAIALYCQPGAKKTEVCGEHDGRLKIRLSAPPVEGKANDALIAWLSKTLKVKQSAIVLIAGDLSRLKRVLVTGVTSESILNLLKT